VIALADWTYPMVLADLGRSPRTVRLIADEAARQAIARSLELETLTGLQADLTIQPWLDGVEIRGRLAAVAGRVCGVSLDQFDEAVDEPVSMRIVPLGSTNARRDALDEGALGEAAEDPPEEAEGPTIDLCALVLECLDLALSPFPRKPGVVFEPPAQAGPPSPFAALANLKRSPDAT